MPHIVDDDEDVLLPDDFVDDSDDLSAPESAKPETESEPESPETDAEPEVAKASDDDDAPEQESYSKRVQKRINKLTAKTRQLEQETNFWKDRVAALEAKTSAREFSDFQQQVAYSEAQLASTYQDAQAAYKRAKEEGDIEGEMKAHDKMLDLRDQIAEKRRLAQAAKEQAEKFQQQTQTPPQPAPRDNGAEVPANLPDGTKQWLKSNPWFMTGSDPTAAKFARELDAALQEEGYTPEDPAMYAELDKRLRAAMPRVAKLMKGKEPPTVPQKLPPKARVAGSSADGQRAGTPSVAGKPTRVLTHSDLDSMRKFNMDPRNPAHRKAWLHRNDPL